MLTRHLADWLAVWCCWRWRCARLVLLQLTVHWWPSMACSGLVFAQLFRLHFDNVSMEGCQLGWTRWSSSHESKHSRNAVGFQSNGVELHTICCVVRLYFDFISTLFRWGCM